MKLFCSIERGKQYKYIINIPYDALAIDELVLYVPVYNFKISTWLLKCLTLVFLFIIRIRFLKGKSIADIIRSRYGEAFVRKIREFEKSDYKLWNGHLDLRFLLECKKNKLFQSFYNLNLRIDTSIILLFIRNVRENYWKKKLE